MSRRQLDADWQVAEAQSDVVGRLSAEVGVSTLVAQLLVNRRLADPATARAFLTPRFRDMPDPFLMKDMDRAVERILHAVERREVICVWGDYDVDGVTSAAQLLRFLSALGVNARAFVPDRFRDGYGLNADRIRELCRDGVELFITVDCGITGVAAVETATEEGADVVIVDHHQPGPQLPKAAAVLDPHRDDCDFPDKALAACGVTWVLLVALRKTLRDRGFFEARDEPDLKDWLDLTAIGTICDMVQLHGLNRAIVAHGLGLIATTARPGVRALCEVADLSADRITSGRVGFHIGPRINAAGRIAHAGAGLDLLVTDDHAEAQLMAQKVDEHNIARRAIQHGVEVMALEIAGDVADPESRRSIVLAHEEWHPGVLGIVATRVVEAFHRPTILMTITDGIAQGSARSISGFRLVEHLHDLKRFLIKYGGHDHAAGLTLKVSDLEAFKHAFEAAAAGVLTEEQLRPRLRIDCVLPLEQVDFQTVHRLSKLEPYGQGNREPALLAEGCVVQDVRKVGKDRSHLKLTLEGGGRRHDAIAFGMAHHEIGRGEHLDVVYIPELNRFRGVDRLQLRVKALRRSA